MAVVKEIVQKEDTVDANQRKMAKNIYRKEIKRWIHVYYVDQALCQV
jgi:uncharacterized protein Yka (UPF0111/DUF47 family)